MCYERRNMAEKKRLTPKEKKRRQRKIILTVKMVALGVLLICLGVVIWYLAGSPKFGLGGNKQSASGSSGNSQSQSGASSQSGSSASSAESPSQQPEKPDREKILAQAAALAVTYDYDGAAELLRNAEGSSTDPEMITKIAEYESAKASCVKVDVNQVTHVFYHSLIVDPQKAFFQDNAQTEGFCEWMTTVDEFNKITQKMYENGFVLVGLHDLVKQTVDENGTVHFAPGEIYLPEGKKAYVLSLDDLSYYHSYDGRGIASKMVVGDDGKPTCEYIQDDGTVIRGAFDCVPLLDKFLEEHPDGSYHGAKGTIALTGYNGILGYRTDSAYKTREGLNYDQQDWLNAHPDFNWEQECEEAKKVAEAIKAQGWTFASHTWGHIRIGDAGLDRIQVDTEKWLQNVAPLIGGTDTIIFAHGQDLGDWHDYAADNEKFNYLKSKGFNIYCNVDSSQYFVQCRDNYLRMGRRNLDGYRLYQDTFNGGTRLSDLFNAQEIWDTRRPTDPTLYDLQ